ncbi:MAG: NYN domain-containing protein [bacterium]
MSKLHNEKQRVLILFDMQNLYYHARNFHNSKVNYQKLIDKALQGRTLVRAIGYGVRGNNPHEEDFFSFLKKSGMEIKTKGVRTFPNGGQKANWDIAIVVDALCLVRDEKIDVVVLATGDGDFVPLVEELHKQGIKVEVVSFRKNTAIILQKAADKFTDLENHMDVLFAGFSAYV